MKDVAAAAAANSRKPVGCNTEHMMKAAAVC